MRASVSGLLVLACCAQATLLAQRQAWWRDPDTQNHLHLTSSQVEEIDRRFRATLDERRTNRELADKADAELADALARGDLSDEAAADLAERVAPAQAPRQLARTRVLLTIYRVLTPEQRAQLDDIQGPPGRPNAPRHSR
jgi:Spy/CpxP family protein refolding chaperone